MTKVLIRKIYSSLFGGSSSLVFRGMAILSLGSGLARGIGVGSIPLLTRLYSPEDFGVLAVFTAIVSLLAPILTLRYVLAMPLPRHDGVAINLMALSLLLMICITGVMTIALWHFAPLFLGLLSVESIAPWWWLILLGIVAAAGYELMTYWAMRVRNYKVIAFTNVWQSVIGSIVKIVLGLFSIQQVGLLFGHVVGNGGGVMVLWRRFADSFYTNWKYIRPSIMRKVAWRYRGFAFYRVPSQFLLVFSSQAPVLLVTLIYDSNTTGQLALALMAVTLPVALFGRTTAKAFYSEASRLGPKQPHAIRAMLFAVIKRLAAIAVAPALILMIFGDKLFPLVFGANWELAGVFSSNLALFIFFQFLQAPVAHVFYIFDKQRSLLVLNIQRTVLIVATFGIVYHLDWSPGSAILCYSLVLSMHYILSIIYAVRLILIEEKLDE